MAWRIEIKGLLDEAQELVKAAETNDKSPSEQLEAAKVLIAAEIESYRGKFPAVKVMAAGSNDPSQRNVSITVHALKGI